MNKALILIFITLINFPLISCKKKINPSLNQPLIVAIHSGNIVQVKKLVGDGADVNANIKGLLTLVEAINKKYTDIAKFLIDEDVNVNLQDKDGDTALIVAALRGNLEIVKLLKQKCADFNIQNKSGKTALMYGVHGGNIAVVDYLLTNGSDVVQQDNKGEDAVSMAIRKKDEKILKLLLINGGAVTLKHLKLAFDLLCIKSIHNIGPEYICKYPKLSAILSEPHLINKDVNYLNTSRLLKTIISEDGVRKAEQYYNGVIKIFNVKDNSFIKAFGNLQFVKEIRYVLQEKMFIVKENNFEIQNYPYYVKYIVNREPFGSCAGLRIFGIGTDEYLFWFIEQNKIKKIANTDRYENFARVSNTGKYYLLIEYSHVAGIMSFAVHDLKNEKKYFIVPNEMRLKIFEPYGRFPSPAYNYVLKFSKNDKYLIFTSFTSSGPTIFAVFNIQQKKAILAQEIMYSPRDWINKDKDINFTDDNKAVVFTNVDGNVTQILIP